MEPNQPPVIDPKYDEQLEKFSENKKANNWVMPFAGLVLSLSAGALCVLLYKYPCNDDCSTKYLFIFVVACLLIIAAIVCFVTYRRIVTAPSVFKKERIFLRDLTIALELAKTLPESYKKTREIKDREGKVEKLETEDQYPRMRQIEKIIQTLTNRYPN